MRPPNNARALVANIGAFAAFSIIPLWIAVFLLALASCGAQPAAANYPEIPDSSIGSYSRNSNNCQPPPSSLVDTCFNSYGSIVLRYPTDTLPSWFFNGCHTLRDSAERCGLSYPGCYSRISFAETQHGVTGVGEVNNLFGMRCTPWRDCTPNGYSKYPTRLHSLTDLTVWERAYPPHDSTITLPVYGPITYWREPAYDFFTRRGWHPDMPRYWAYLQTLNQ